MRTLRLTALGGAILVGTTGCDYSGDWLFAGEVENVPGIYHIFNEEDGTEYLVPFSATTEEELRAGTIYGEVGATSGATRGGVTFNFIGTGGPVCVFTDPETIFWNTQVAAIPDDTQRAWSYPDNPYDDGDLDVYVGLSAYYTGSPGLTVGDFVVSYTDSLGNEVPIELSECTNLDLFDDPGGFSGRASSELCNLPFTSEGISYTGLLQTFSTPLDDDRLGYGLILFDGTCDEMVSLVGASEAASGTLECVILGESLIPFDNPESLYYTGYEPTNTWSGATAAESEFCLNTEADMRAFCRAEASDKEAVGGCEFNTVTDEARRCYCGDPNDVPDPGAG